MTHFFYWLYSISLYIRYMIFQNKSLVFGILLLGNVAFLTGFYNLAYSQSADDFDRIFSAWNHTDTPGGAVAVIKDGQLLFSKGYGMADLEHRVAISPQTVFYAGSVSKQFVTTCIAILEERGKLQFTDEVNLYFPEFKDYGHAITLEHLIHHTSGIKDYFRLLNQAGEDYFDHPPLDNVLELIFVQNELDFAPGTQYRYSNSGYLMLAQIVEKVSGMSFSQFAQQEIFDALGMRQSKFLDDVQLLIPDRAWGYQIDSDGKVLNQIMRFDLVGSGGLYTSINDLIKWDANFASNKLNHHSSSLQKTLHKKGKINAGTENQEELNYAMALSYREHNGNEMVGHTGSLGGYRAAYFRVPLKNLSVIILTNASNYTPVDQVNQIVDLFD